MWVAVWLLVRPGKMAAAEATVTAPVAAPVRWSEVLSDRHTWGVAGARVLSDNVWWLLLYWMPDLFHRVFHLGMDAFGAPLAVIYACAAVGSLIAGFASTRLLRAGISLNTTRKTLLLISALLVTPVWLAPGAGSYWIAAGLLGLTLAAHQGFSVNVFSLATDVSPPARVATVIAVGAFCGNLSGMVILQVAGWTLDHGYGYGPLLAWASVSYLLGAGWVQLLLPRITAAAPEPEAALA